MRIQDITFRYEAFRWTDGGGVESLGDLPGGESNFSYAYDASADGNVVVGDGRSASGQEAFRWTPEGGMVGLGDLAGGGFQSTAKAVSDDGNVVVGEGATEQGLRAFRWTAGDGLVDLGVPDGFRSTSAYAISGDGSVILVTATGPGERSASFIWTEQRGYQNLLELLLANGASIPDGWRGIQPTALSFDGTWATGAAFIDEDANQEAFLANLTVVPIPAGGWLVVPLLGVLVGARRRAVRESS
jgi:probable HAF family extracellular repeat protein